VSCDKIGRQFEKISHATEHVSHRVFMPIDKLNAFNIALIILPFLCNSSSMNFENEINTVLQARRADTDMVNVVEALGYDSDDFQKAFDIALQMENRNLVKLIYSNFNAGKVVVEFTLLAKK
jgi:hypothetical protein